MDPCLVTCLLLPQNQGGKPVPSTPLRRCIRMNGFDVACEQVGFINWFNGWLVDWFCKLALESVAFRCESGFFWGVIDG